MKAKFAPSGKPEVWFGGGRTWRRGHPVPSVVKEGHGKE